MSSWHASAYAMTKAEHDADMASRTRPVTQGPMRRAARDDQDLPDWFSIVDRVIADTRRKDTPS